MTIEQCYEQMEGDYEDVVRRLRSEILIQRFLLKFPADTSYGLLCSSLEEKNMKEAFRASHTLKGVAQNLGFRKLHESSHLLTEALRGGQAEGTEALFEAVSEAYAQTVAAIRSYEADNR